MIFDLLAKFADYGFNKSHAAAYGIVSYQTAYLKAHYPVEFLAASMTYDMANTDKLVDFRQDAMRLGIEVVPPSVQTSFRHFEVPARTGSITRWPPSRASARPPSSTLSRSAATRRLPRLRISATRIDTAQVNRRTLESLIAAGALDCFGHDRAAFWWRARPYHGLCPTRAGKPHQRPERHVLARRCEAETIQLPAATPWLPAEKLHREYQALGFYLSAHPLDSYNDLLAKMRVQNWADFSLAVKAGATAGRLAGTVTSKQERKTRTGNKMGIVAFSDSSGQYEAVLFSEGLALYRELLEPGKSIVITVNAEERPEGIGLRIQTADSLEDRAARGQSALRVYMRDARPLNSVSTHLKSRGEGQVSFVMIKDDGRREIEVTLPDRYKISPQLASALKAAPGVLDVELV
jgi:DNA polymerase-3 subunit alpha